MMTGVAAFINRADNSSCPVATSGLILFIRYLILSGVSGSNLKIPLLLNFGKEMFMFRASWTVFPTLEKKLLNRFAVSLLKNPTF